MADRPALIPLCECEVNPFLQMAALANPIRSEFLHTAPAQLTDPVTLLRADDEEERPLAVEADEALKRLAGLRV